MCLINRTGQKVAYVLLCGGGGVSTLNYDDLYTFLKHLLLKININLLFFERPVLFINPLIEQAVAEWLGPQSN